MKMSHESDIRSNKYKSVIIFVLYFSSRQSINGPPGVLLSTPCTASCGPWVHGSPIYGINVRFRMS